MGKRAGSDEAARLLTCGTAEEWQQAIDMYDQAINHLSQEKGKAGLVELDRWWRLELPLAIQAREGNGHVTCEELVKLVQWKLWVGKTRPNLLRFAKEAKPSQVETKSREAFECLGLGMSKGERSSGSSGGAVSVPGDVVRKAVGMLTSGLKGVGPATASAVLAASCAGCPFDADEVIDSVMKTGVRKYNLPEYLKVHESLTSKAVQLGRSWDAERVRRALWARAMCSRFGLVAGQDRARTPTDTDGRTHDDHPAGAASGTNAGESDSNGTGAHGVGGASARAGGRSKSKRTRARESVSTDAEGSPVGKPSAKGTKRRRKSSS